MSANAPAQTSLLQDVRALPRAVWPLFIGAFLNRFGSFVVIFLALYLTERGYGAAQAGIAVGAYGFGHVFAVSIGGTLADRWGRHRTIALSMGLAALAFLALGQAGAYPLIVLFAFVSGVGAEMYRPATSALIADLVPAERRLSAFAVYRLCINVGFAAGPLVAGLLSERSFGLLFVGQAITSIAFGAIVLLWVRAPSRPASAGSHRALPAFSDGGFVVFLAATFLVAWVFLQHQSTVGLFVHDQGLSNATYGLLIGMNGLVVAIFELPLTAAVKRWSARTAIASGFVLTGVGFGINAVAHDLPVLALSVIVWTLGEILFMPRSTAYIAEIAPPDLRGRYMAAWELMWSLGLILAPSVGNVAYRSAGRPFWLACAVAGLAAGLAVSLTMRRAPRPDAVPMEA